jgi:ubiquinone/menaquinone biosynthesis C-methylase UbiE
MQEVIMSLYEKYVLPSLINVACSTKPVIYQRKKVVPLAQGRILEVGMGSGLNIDYYDPEKVELVWGLEPSEGMRSKAADKIDKAPFEVRLLDLPGEEIPLEDNCVDTVLLTYTLCTIQAWQQAMEQMRRVLKPNGQLIFCEHGEAPDENIRKWQARINPYWKKIAGGCNLNRPIPDCLTQSGFKIESLDSMYLPSTPKIMGYNYWGVSKIA